MQFHGKGVFAFLQKFGYVKPVIDQRIFRAGEMRSVQEIIRKAVYSLKVQKYALLLREFRCGERAFIAPAIKFVRAQQLDIVAKEDIRQHACVHQIDFHVAGHGCQNGCHAVDACGIGLLVGIAQQIVSV